MCCAKVQRYTNGLDFAAFKSDDGTYDAVVGNLEIIGEAAKQLPDRVKAMVPGLDWRKITELWDTLAHASFGIDDEVIWDVVCNKVPELRSALETVDPDS